MNLEISNLLQSRMFSKRPLSMESGLFFENGGVALNT